MKSIIIRSFFIAALGLLVTHGLHAQRGYRGRGYGHYRHSYVTISPRVYIGKPRYYGGYYRYPGYRSYGYYGGYYGGFVRPRIGVHISILPPGYWSFNFGGYPYYYYGGAYYRPIPHTRNYEVVDAPLGASVPELPEGAQVVVINDQKYYELDGTYYKEDIRHNNEIWYTVVGKHGKLDTDDAPVQSPSQSQPTGPVVGDVVDKLPDNCRTVTVSGHTYYVSPDDVYYEETMQQNTLRYKVVGK